MEKLAGAVCRISLCLTMKGGGRGGKREGRVLSLFAAAFEHPEEGEGAGFAGLGAIRYIEGGKKR